MCFRHSLCAIFIAALIAATGSVSATCVYQQGTADASMPGSNNWYDPFTASSSDSLSNVQVFISGTANGYVAIYADNAGAPGTLLGASIQTALTYGWNTVSLTSTVGVVTSTPYWVMVATDSVPGFIGSTFLASSPMRSTGAYAAPVDNPTTTATGNTSQMAMRLGSTCAGPTATPTLTVTVTPSPTQTALGSITSTVTPSVSPMETTSSTGTPSWTQSSTATQTPSYSSTFTGTPSFTATPSSTQTDTSSATPSASSTSSGTSTFTPTSTVTPTRTASPTATPTFTPTASPTFTPYCYAYTLVGDGTAGSTGDGAAATAAKVYGPRAVAVDSQGRLLIAEYDGNRVRRIGTDGSITTVAGTGSPGIGADGIVATASALNGPQGIAVDGLGAIFISEVNNHRIRRVDPVTGLISTIAGTGSQGSTGLTSTALATSIQLSTPSGLAIDTSGNLFVADYGNHAIRRIAPTGMMSTVVGTGVGGFNAASQAASVAQLKNPSGVAFDLQGALLIADSGNHAVRRLDAGVLTTLAGTGVAGGTTATVTAVGSQLNFPTSAVVDGAGTIYIGEFNGNMVRQISGGNLSLLAGTGTAGYNSDNIPASAAALNQPYGLLVNSQGDLIVADSGNNRVRRLNSCGVARFVRPNLPACYFGVSVASAAAARSGIKSSASAPSFDAVLAPNPVAAGGALVLVYQTPLQQAWAKVYGVDGSLRWQGGRVDGQQLHLTAPVSPGVYLVEVEARDPWGGVDKKLLKLAVVGR